MTAGTPRGIEVLLKKARVDASFRKALRRDPVSAAGLIGLVLSPAERAILAAVPRGELLAMAERVEVPVAQRGVFRGRAAAAMLAVLAGASALGCGGEPPAPTPATTDNEPGGWMLTVPVFGISPVDIGKPDFGWDVEEE